MDYSLGVFERSIISSQYRVKLFGLSMMTIFEMHYNYPTVTLTQ